MPFASFFLLLPLFAAPRDDSLIQALDAYARRPPAESATEILRGLPSWTGMDQRVARFLLAQDLVDVGLVDAPARMLETLAGDLELGGAAFVALARLRNDAGEDARLRAEAVRAPWEKMTVDEATEATYRVAVACHRDGRPGEAVEWLKGVAASSRWFPYARLLAAQSEFALGRYGEAIRAAEPIFGLEPEDEDGRLVRDRATVLVAEMLIEIGLHEEAISVLGWVEGKSPFRRRADLGVALARGLRFVAVGDLRSSQRYLDLVDRRLDEQAAEVEDLVAATGPLHRRARELERAWPSRRLTYERRRWTAERSARALESGSGSALGRLGAALWESLPPVMAWRLASDTAAPVAPDSGHLAAEGSPFFPPDVDTGRALLASSLLRERTKAKSCPARAADALRVRAVRTLLGELPSPPLADLGTLARGCGADDETSPDALAEEKLSAALSATARRHQRTLRRQRYVLDEVVATAKKTGVETIETVRSPE